MVSLTVLYISSTDIGGFSSFQGLEDITFGFSLQEFRFEGAA
jgi:hypothetical protein